MDERQRDQIGRILGQAVTTASATLALSLESASGEFRAAGRLGSGAFQKNNLRKVAEASDHLVTQTVYKVAAVSKSEAAFDEIRTTIRRWLRSCEVQLSHYAGNGDASRYPDIGPAALASCQSRFADIVKSIEERLAIEAFDFCDPAPASIAASKPHPAKGGRPPAEFWDDMWAAIATSLYSGDLQPKSQADLVRAMTDWIEASGQGAAESTIKARARRLWDRIEALDA